MPEIKIKTEKTDKIIQILYVPKGSAMDPDDDTLLGLSESGELYYFYNDFWEPMNVSSPEILLES